ncbi:hypothetical protein [Stieleria varia]|uniref:Uncharacterized protein n=1 Tax=Stieleria varia TaxID=2528005 RepID=A0A5C6BDF2_9BACT|nr:hypothetical protein [Stieleria varia]TWU08474.1 hypothetical protein Pla52n_10570 [Stieleria varia]
MNPYEPPGDIKHRLDPQTDIADPQTDDERSDSHVRMFLGAILGSIVFGLLMELISRLN